MDRDSLAVWAIVTLDVGIVCYIVLMLPRWLRGEL